MCAQARRAAAPDTVQTLSRVASARTRSTDLDADGAADEQDLSGAKPSSSPPSRKPQVYVDLAPELVASVRVAAAAAMQQQTQQTQQRQICACGRALSGRSKR